MDKEFDEDEAVSYMLQKAQTVETYDDDQLLNVIDIIWDYYEEHGDLSLDADDEHSDADPSRIIEHVKKVLAKDKGNLIIPEDVAPLVLAELDYENSVFENE